MKKKKWLVVSVVILTLLFAVGCSMTEKDPEYVRTTSIVKPIDYGNGVYYFETVRAKFGNSLADFLENHPLLQVVSITGDGTRLYGEDRGYFVVFSKK